MAELSTLGSVIKTAYEGESNTNAFTDALQSKLNGISAGADVTPELADVATTGAYADLIGTPSTFPPAAHTHTIAQVTGLQDALDGLGGDVAWGDITGVPAALTSAQAAGTASIRAIGTTATTAAAGDHTHTPAAIGAATAAQGALADTAVQPGDLPQGISVADAEDETEVVGQFNALLASLRTAGLIAT